MDPKIWTNTIITVVVAVALSISAQQTCAQKLTPKEAADKAQKNADAATKAADEAKASSDAANQKTNADKDADKADEQAAKDEKAARDAQEKLDKSQADVDANKPGSADQRNKDKTEADAAAQKAVDSKKAAQNADAKADAVPAQGFYQKNNRDKQLAKRKAIQDAWVKKRQAKGLPIPSWALSKTISLGRTATGIGGGETCAVLISTGKIKVETSGTGETIGHIADFKIQNLTDQMIMCAIPPMILESGSGKNQHYACPKGQTVALNPHQEKTVPMDGVCLNRSKPPVGKGVTGDLVINEGNPTLPQNPNSHVPPKDANKLLGICTAKYEAADKLQKDGALKDLPYKDKQKQKDIVTQWSTWMDPQICQLLGTPPATKEDLRKVVYKQVPEPMTPETKKKIDKGIETIFEKVELTSATAKDLEKPDQYAQTEPPNSMFEVSDQQGKPAETPPPQTQEKPKKKTESPPPQTQEKPKEKIKWPKEIQDWLDKRNAALNALVAKLSALSHYNFLKKDFFRYNSKHWLELKEKERNAFDKAQTVGATQKDKVVYNDAVKELQKLETELEKDFVQTPVGKEEFGKVQEAEKTATQADNAAKEASKNIPQDGKDKILDAMDAQFEKEEEAATKALKDEKAAKSKQPKTDEKPQEAAPKKP